MCRHRAISSLLERSPGPLSLVSSRLVSSSSSSFSSRVLKSSCPRCRCHCCLPRVVVVVVPLLCSRHRQSRCPRDPLVVLVTHEPLSCRPHHSRTSRVTLVSPLSSHPATRSEVILHPPTEEPVPHLPLPHHPLLLRTSPRK